MYIEFGSTLYLRWKCITKPYFLFCSRYISFNLNCIFQCDNWLSPQQYPTEDINHIILQGGKNVKRSHKHFFFYFNLWKINLYNSKHIKLYTIVQRNHWNYFHVNCIFIFEINCCFPEKQNISLYLLLN